MMYISFCNSHEIFLLRRAAWLDLLLIVHIETQVDLRVNPEPLFDHSADPGDALLLPRVSQPHRQLVPLGPYINHCTVHLEEIEGSEMRTLFRYLPNLNRLNFTD